MVAPDAAHSAQTQLQLNPSAESFRPPPHAHSATSGSMPAPSAPVRTSPLRIIPPPSDSSTALDAVSFSPSQGVCSPSPQGRSTLLHHHRGGHRDGKWNQQPRPVPPFSAGWMPAAIMSCSPPYPSPDTPLYTTHGNTMHPHMGHGHPYVAMAHPYWIPHPSATYHPGVVPSTYADSAGVVMPMAASPMAMHCQFVPNPHMLAAGMPAAFPGPPLPHGAMHITLAGGSPTENHQGSGGGRHVGAAARRGERGERGPRAHRGAQQQAARRNTQATDSAAAAEAAAYEAERRAHYAHVEQQLGLKPDELIGMNSRQRRHLLRRRMREEAAEAAVTEGSTTETAPTDHGGDDDEASSEMTLTASNSDLHSASSTSNMNLSGMMELSQELAKELVLRGSCDELDALEGEASRTESPSQPPPPSYKPATSPPAAT